MVTDKLAHSIWNSISNRMHLQARRREDFVGDWHLMILANRFRIHCANETVVAILLQSRYVLYVD